MNATPTERAADALRVEILACAERTLAASGAQIEFRRELHWEWKPPLRQPRRRGGLLRPVGKVAKTAAKATGAAAWKRLTDGKDPGGLSAEGFIEPAARRYMLDFGHYADIYTDGKRWGGRSGRPLATLDPWPSDGQIGLWWLLDVLRGTTAATAEGEDTLHGVTCRRVRAVVDLDRASAAAGGGLRVPTVDHVEDLHALPITVWIDCEHVRQVRFREGREATSTLLLELHDFNAPTTHLDWERLPTFRSPEEAALAAGERGLELSERVLARIFNGRG